MDKYLFKNRDTSSSVPRTGNSLEQMSPTNMAATMRDREQCTAAPLANPIEKQEEHAQILDAVAQLSPHYCGC